MLLTSFYTWLRLTLSRNISGRKKCLYLALRHISPLKEFLSVVEFLLYWTPSGDSTTTLLPVLSSTRNDSGLKVGVNLFSVPVLKIPCRLLSLHFREHGVSHQHTFFPFSLASLSLSCTSWSSTGNSSIPGMRVRNFLRNRSSAGLTPVVLCGVVLYIDRKDAISSFQFLFSICAILILFSREWFCLSTSPFA